MTSAAWRYVDMQILSFNSKTCMGGVARDVTVYRFPQIGGIGGRK